MFWVCYMYCSMYSRHVHVVVLQYVVHLTLHKLETAVTLSDNFGVEIQFSYKPL